MRTEAVRTYGADLRYRYPVCKSDMDKETEQKSRKIRIFVCALVLAAALAGTFLLPAAAEEQSGGVVVGLPAAAEEQNGGAAVQPSEAEYTVAWWSMMYEMPNPEQLPVRVRFQWLKGLE